MSEDVDINELEKMAKFRLTEKERGEAKEYMEFLTFDLDKLQQADTDGVKPLIHGIELENVFREDVAIKIIDRETLLESAPEHEDGYFKVPKTID